MNVLKIAAEKIYGGAGVYGMKVTVWLETDDGDEMTAVYVTDGADGGLAVYEDLLDSVDGVKPIKEYADGEEASDSEYGDVLAVVKNAAKLIDA